MNPASDFIPVAVPDLGGNEEAYVVDALRSTWISSTGKYVDLFEQRFAAYCGTDAAIAVTNGTAALHLLLAGLGLGPGDEVIVPALTFVATANAVVYTGARPVFADIDRGTWCLDPGPLESLITERTRGIVAVHLYGHPADMDGIKAVAARHGLWVIEDAAQAHGARYKGRTVGSLATAATFSFYGNKILTSGEGGAIAISDSALEARLRMLRGQGMEPGRQYYFPVVGYNFRMTNIACALLCAQLERVPGISSQRKRVYEGYRKRLAGVPGIGFQPVAAWAEPAEWLFSILIDPDVFGCGRDDLIAHLKAARIESRPFFIPLHTLPPYAAARRAGDLGVSSSVAARGISLPTHGGLDDSMLDRIAEAILGAPRKRRASQE